MTPSLEPLESRSAPAVLPVGLIAVLALDPPPPQQDYGLPAVEVGEASAGEEAKQLLGVLP